MDIEAYLDGSYLFDPKRLARSWESVRRAGMPAPAELMFIALKPFGPSGPTVVIPPIEPPPIAPPVLSVLPPTIAVQQLFGLSL